LNSPKGKDAVFWWWRLTATLLLGLSAGVPVAGTGDEAPPWAVDLGLFVFGGPPPGVVEIEVNGEFAARVVEGTPSSIEIADLLREGVNELELELTPGEPVSTAAGPVKIRIAGSEKVNEFRRAVKDPRVEVVVPGKAPAAPCREAVRFWAGPPPASPPPLTRRYWLAYEGPPVHHRVTVWLNDVPVYAASAGNTLVEITRHVRPGKNTATFEAVPTCFVPRSDRSGPLAVFIASGRQEEDDVVFDGPPLANFDLPRKEDPKPIRRAQAFRAR
jgi:hypothetical protein